MGGGGAVEPDSARDVKALIEPEGELRERKPGGLKREDRAVGGSLRSGFNRIVGGIFSLRGRGRGIRMAEDPERRNFAEPFQETLCEGGLPPRNILNAGSFQKGERRGEPVNSGEIHRACLQTVRKEVRHLFAVRAASGAAGDQGRKLFSETVPEQDSPDPLGAEKALVPGEAERVDLHFFHIDRH